MKKLALLLVILGIGLSSCQLSARGYYIPILDIMKCGDYDTCLHEVGHKVDWEQGVTKNSEWKKAVDYYRVLETMLPDYARDKIAVDIIFFPGVGMPGRPCKDIQCFAFYKDGWGGYSELYAWVLQQSGGDINKIPGDLRKFYDMGRILELWKGW
jgi:hypothetical protein